MKRLCLALFLVAAAARAQYTDFAHHGTASAGHANGLPAATYVGPYSGTPVLGDMIVFNGTNWVSIAAGTNGQVLTEQSSLLPHWATPVSGGASVNDHFVTTQTDADIPNSFSLGTLATGILIGTVSGGASTVSAYGGAAACTNQVVTAISAVGATTCASIVNAMITNSTIDLTTKVTGVLPTANGGIASSPCTPSPVLACFWEDFYPRYTGAATLQEGNVGIVCAGTGASTATPTVAADGNHPGVLEVTAGTSAGSGVCAALAAMNSGSGADSIVFGTNAATVEWEADMQTASGATNTARVYFGFGDVVGGGDIVDGAVIYWDNNADTHWGCETAANSVRTTTISTNAGSTGWHKFNVSVNAAGTSVAFKVDGVALSCSPLTTNIPTGNSRGTAVLSKIVQTAGATGLLLDWDYVWYSQAVTR